MKSNKNPAASAAVKIQGTLTSQIQVKNKDEPYYYTFIKIKNQSIDLPVIFKEKPNLKKSDQAEFTGYYSISEKSVRKSFTCLDYQLKSP